MKRLAAAVVTAALSLWANPSAQAEGTRVVITFKAGMEEPARAQALAQLGAVPVGGYIESNDQAKKFIAVVADMPAPAVAPDANVAMSLDAMPKPEGVETIDQEFKIRWIESASFQGTPFPAGASLAELGLSKMTRSFSPASIRGEIPWGVNAVRASAAWDYTEGAGVRVFVIDTGINANHPEFNGKIDNGYNAFTDQEGVDAALDDNGHGTHVAGTIAAKRDGRGVVGVAPRARLYSVKVLDADGSGTLSGVIKGIIWAANNGCQVANMSLGAPIGTDSMQRALRYAKGRNCVVVAAAGNSGSSVGYPAAYPETIAVAASDWMNRTAKFSSRGPEVDFIAPGVAVLSTSWSKTDRNGDYASLSGTSMAAPHVAGLAALAVAQGYRGLDGPDGVMEQLKKAAHKIKPKDVENAEYLPDTEQGSGMIDALDLTRTADLNFASAGR